MSVVSVCDFFFFFNDTATTEIYTLSLHDALPILPPRPRPQSTRSGTNARTTSPTRSEEHTSELQSPYEISYAVFCLKKIPLNREAVVVGILARILSREGVVSFA